MNAEKSEMNDLDRFLKDLASADPTPGGGSVAALAGALGSALTNMVAEITMKKAELEDGLRADMEELVKTAGKTQIRFKELIAEDAGAYDSVLAAYRLPKETEEEKKVRSETIAAAFKHAAEVPFEVLENASELAPLALLIAEKGSENCLSDTSVAVSMISAAVNGAYMNVEINLKYIKDMDYKDELSSKLNKLKSESEDILAKANDIIIKRFK
jgi:formiminotetrahydrofolate cyclodeaminase